MPSGLARRRIALPWLEKTGGGAAGLGLRRKQVVEFIFSGQDEPLARDYASEVFVQGVEGIRFQVGEDPPQAVLDSVKRVEKRSAVDLQSAAAEPPIRPQKKMVIEYLIFGCVQVAAADKTKIGCEFLSLPAIRPVALLAPAEFN